MSAFDSSRVDVRRRGDHECDVDIRREGLFARLHAGRLAREHRAALDDAVYDSAIHGHPVPDGRVDPARGGTPGYGAVMDDVLRGEVRDDTRGHGTGFRDRFELFVEVGIPAQQGEPGIKVRQLKILR